MLRAAELDGILKATKQVPTQKYSEPIATSHEIGELQCACLQASCFADCVFVCACGCVGRRQRQAPQTDWALTGPNLACRQRAHTDRIVDAAGWYSKPLMQNRKKFGVTNCEITRYANDYAQAMGRNPFARKEPIVGGPPGGG
jgi:hypothetical protein